MKTFKKGLFNNELRKSLFVRETPINTKADLKKAVAAAQVGLLQYARTYTNLPASATAGLGAIQKDELETRRKTNRQVAEVLKRYGPVTTNSAEEETPMELDAIQKEEEGSGEEYEEGSEEEVDDVLFFMAPNHDKLRSREEIDATDYWEAGITAEAICTLKQGNMDHSQKTCYHCDRKGHIKANCPARKNLYKRPWTKIPMSREKRATARKGFGRGRGRGRFVPKRYDTSGRKFTENAQAIQPSEEDF